MKRIFVTSAIIGLLAVPSLALATRGGVDNDPLDIRRENRRNEAVLVAPRIENNRVEVEDDDDVAIPAGSISVDQAKAAAMAVFPDKTFNKVEVELEDGIVVFSVRFADDSRVDVQASDGAVVRVEDEAMDIEVDNSGPGSLNSGRGK